LVIQASGMAAGGEVFLLDMGEPVKIFDLAKLMIELSGMTVRDESNPQGDIDIQFTGLRPGEKLYEELLIGNNPMPTNHPLIMKANEDFLSWEDLKIKLDTLENALNLNNILLIRESLKDLVAGYQPEDLVDDQ
jgi:FlaA1/EpsC-like NDP-sugar epimerase